MFFGQKMFGLKNVFKKKFSFMVVCKPILVFSLSLCQAEQNKLFFPQIRQTSLLYNELGAVIAYS